MPIDHTVSLALGTAGLVSGANIVQNTFQQLSSNFKELTGFTEKFNKQGERTQIVLRGLKANGEVLSTTLKKQGNDWRVLGQNTRQAAQEMSTADKIFKQIVLRIGGIQLFHQSVRRLLSELRIGGQEARDFSKRVAEIESITLDAGKSTESWYNDLRRLSDLYGKGLLENAEATYQALSNQVVGAANATNFLAEATKLATVAVGTTDEAVNILSSNINAYGDSALTANMQSAVFFKTVEQGRLRLSDLANDYGTSANLANQLNVNFIELNASLATLTRSGIRTAQAQTLINAIMQKMVQPTKEMKSLFKEWGVTTGEQAIQTYGLVGVMRLLSKEVESGGASRLAELFSRLRAQRGGAGLINALENFDSIFKEIGGTVEGLEGAAEDFEKAYSIAFDTVGARADRARQRFSNFFVLDLATDFQKLLVNLNGTIGGLESSFDGFFRSIRDMAAAGDLVFEFLGTSDKWMSFAGVVTYTLGAAGSAFLIYRTSVLLATAAMNNWSRASRFTVSGIEAASRALGIASLVWAGSRLAFDLLTESIEEQTARLSELISERQRAEGLNLAAQQIKQQEAFRAINAELASMNANYQDLSTVIAQRLTPELKNQELLWDSIRSKIDLAAVSTKAIVTDALKTLEDAVKRIQKAEEELDKKRSVAYTNYATGLAVVEKLQKEVARDIASNNFDKAYSSLDKAGDILESLAKLNTSNLKSANRDLQDVLKTIKDIQSTTASEVFDLGLQGKTEGQKLRALEQKIAGLRQQAQASTPAQAAEQLEEAQELAKKAISIRGQLVSGLGVSVSTQLYQDIATERLAVQRQIEESKKAEVAALELKQSKLEEAQLDNLNKQIVAAKLVADQVQRRAEQELRVVELQEKFQQNTKNIQKSQNELLQRQKDAAAEAAKLETELPNQLGKVPQFLFSSLSPSRAKFKTNVALDKERIDNALVAGDFKLISKLATDAQLNIAKSGLRFEGDVREAALAFQKIGVTAEGIIKARREVEETGKAAKGLEQLTKGGDLQTLPEVARDLAESFRSLKTELDSLRAKGAPGGPARATGGGIDTDYFLGTPGETVINRFAARRFAPQLMAINSGVAGYSSTINRNVEIGSLNVSLQSAGNAQVDAQAIGHALKREIRRGSFSWS